MSRIFDENLAKRQKRPRVISTPENDNLDCPTPTKIPKYKEIDRPYREHLFQQQQQPVEEAPPPLVLKP